MPAIDMDIPALYQWFLQYPSVSTDTRQTVRDTIFVALRGANFDGNQFVQQALDKGAQYAVTDDTAFRENNRCMVVEDTLAALQKLAAYHRRKLSVTLLAITGSNGKTTTKELTREILKTQYHVVATEGNLNNHIGVPLTLLRMKQDTELAIIEMGANHRGEIAKLCEIAQPDTGMITNVGKAHLEGFGSLQGVKQAKGELYDYLRTHVGTALVNADHDYLLRMAVGIPRIITYGRDEQADFYGEVAARYPSLTVQCWRPKLRLSTKLAGDYNFDNVMAAVGAGKYFDVPDAAIVKAIESYQPNMNRSEIVQYGSNRFIMDAYNANPVSMSAAVQHMAGAPGDKKVVILGDMLELGRHAESEHQKIVDIIEKATFREAVLVGPVFSKVAQKTTCRCFADFDRFWAWFRKQPFKDCHFLVKGSRDIGLQKLSALLGKGQDSLR